jgi:hypothetical protein
VIRVFTGIVALGLYLSYIPDLERLFGPDGLLSESAMLRLRGSVPIFSIFDYSHSATSLWILFWAGAFVIGLFLFGVFTRVNAVLALIAVLSLIHRGPVLSRPVDEVLVVVMFCLCLGPSGAALSLDSWWKRRHRDPLDHAADSPPKSWAATVAIRLMQIHVALIYFLMALAKLRTRTPVWWSGTAVWGLIAKPESRLVDLTFLADHIYLINAWTLAIVVFEFCFAFLVWNRLARPLLLGLAVPIWIGTALLTGMTSWAVMMLIANLAFLSPATLRARLTRQSSDDVSSHSPPAIPT